MKSRLIGVLTILALSISATAVYVNANAAVKVGAKCKVVGQIKAKKSKEFTCIAKGKKLVWSKGKIVITSKKVSKTLAPVESAANLPFEMCSSDADTCFSWSPDASQKCIDNYPLLLTEENRLARGPFEECVYELDFLGIEHLTPERFMGPVSDTAKKNAKRLQSLGWDRPQTSPIQMLATPDVPQYILDATTKGLRAATDYLGNYGPLKFYTVGNDPKVVEPIIKDFCSWGNSNISFEACSQDQGEAMREMSSIYPGGNAFAGSAWQLDKPVAYFVNNPCANEQNEFCSKKFPEELIGLQKMTAHEYFHVYQGSQQIFRPPYEGGFPMPRWFEEGAATYFGMFLAEQEGWNSNVRLETTRENIGVVQHGLKTWPSLRLIDIETEAATTRTTSYCQSELCLGFLQYGMGYLAMAFLADITSDEAIFFDFYEASKTDGFYKAFADVFGRDINAFYEEFDVFLKLSPEKQLKALT